MVLLQSLGSFTITLIALATSTLYMLPSLIGVLRQKRRQWAIFALNLLLGWTLIGWGLALIWACARPSKSKAPAVKRAKPSTRRNKASAAVANDNIIGDASSFWADQQTFTRDTHALWPMSEAKDDYADWLDQSYVRDAGKSPTGAGGTPRPPSDRRSA